MSKKNLRSSIDDFPRKEDIFEEAQASRAQVDRILNPKKDITISSLPRAAALVGRRVTIELV